MFSVVDFHDVDRGFIVALNVLEVIEIVLNICTMFVDYHNARLSGVCFEIKRIVVVSPQIWPKNE